MSMPLAHNSDRALVRRFSDDHDELAFAEIVRRHADHVYSACLRVLGDASLAEDAAQDTFFKLMRKPPAVRVSLGGWLHRTATRQAIDRLRNERSRRARERAYGTEARAIADDGSGWDALAPHVDAALAELSQRHRAVLVEHFLCDRSLSEIADEWGVSRATMSRWCRAALNELRRRLHHRGVACSVTGLGAALLAHTAEAAPAALVQSLRKAALASGAVHESAAGAALYISPKAIAGGAGVLMLTGVCVVLLVMTSVGSPREPREPAPAIASAGGAAMVEDAPTYIMLPSAGESLAADEIAMFEAPAGGADERLSVVFGDGHVESLGVDELRRRVEAQTGRPLTQLLPSSSNSAGNTTRPPRRPGDS